jgi:sRNA-binding protein
MTVKQPPPAPNPPTAAAPIILDRDSEARRAYRESRTAITLLQQRWPAAFPERPQQVRPLIAGLTPLLAAALDWSPPYTRAVLRTWKLRPAYCHAVLAHPVRFDLDGNPTDQPVDEDARTQAKTRLATWASKRRRPALHKPPGGGGDTTASSPTRAPVIANRPKPPPHRH